MAVAGRVHHEPGFVLHTYSWRETSLIIEVFTRRFGRLPLVAKGARRPTSALRGVLMAFQPLALSWSGKAEVKTLTDAQWQAGQGVLAGVALLCGYYLNELIIRLLPRDDAHPALYDAYVDSLQRLSRGEQYAPLLRSFELRLLRELGYGPTFDVLADSGDPVQAERHYLFITERGVLEADEDYGDAPTVPGRALLDMARMDFSDVETLAHAKVLMRRLIHHHLGGQSLESRRILLELQEL